MSDIIDVTKRDCELLAKHKNGILIILAEKGQAVERHLIVSDDPSYLRETSKALFAVAELGFYEMEGKRKAQEAYVKAASEPIVVKEESKGGN
jgi:hypothetical protein